MQISIRWRHHDCRVMNLMGSVARSPTLACWPSQRATTVASSPSTNGSDTTRWRVPSSGTCRSSAF